ncbi:MAG TPA: hypothetical protein PLT65_01610 [Bacilli bacterium]|nr:hypothetical protein [Bacilli bacterium]
MKEVERIINECGVSKVRVAKYLGVSRQMLYNYFAMNFNDMPKEKTNKILKLFSVTGEGELETIVVDDDYAHHLDEKLSDEIMDLSNKENISNLTGLNKKEQELLTDIFNLLKESLVEDKSNESYDTLRYLYHYLQAMESVKELKYMLAYMSKSLGVTNPLEFVFNEDEQYCFEGIIFSAMTLYTNGGASKSKVSESHKRFEQEISIKKEETLSRTQELNTFKNQALNELGYSSINETNAKEVFEKIAEIMSRKV